MQKQPSKETMRHLLLLIRPAANQRQRDMEEKKICKGA
jgi:hypothetical protein